MYNNAKRVFRFTSSNAWKLLQTGRGPMGFGEKAITYINEKRAERCLGRSLDLGASSQALVWGKVMEHYCDKYHLGPEYELCSTESVIHPKYPFWSGSPDAKTISKAVEIKCFYPKAFYELSSLLITEDLDAIRKDQKEAYWQVLSNAEILSLKKAEIIAYTPTEAQLIEIRKEVCDTGITEALGLEAWQTRFIWESDIDKLPYIPEGIAYPNFVKFSFDVPQEDFLKLESAMVNANKLLTA